MTNDIAGLHIACMNRAMSPGGKSLRTGRRSIPGQIYLVTTVTRWRQPYFLVPELARRAAKASSDVQLWRPSRCLCWVLMPDHWHGLIELGDETDLSAIMRRFKGALARALNQQIGRTGPTWAEGFHDHALRHDESVHAAARYIIANPLRAGLVKDILDYPYWDTNFPDFDVTSL